MDLPEMLQKFRGGKEKKKNQDQVLARDRRNVPKRDKNKIDRF